jgi:hypothetical protein
MQSGYCLAARQPHALGPVETAGRAVATVENCPPSSRDTPRQAAYDLKKLRGKDFVRRIDGTRRYEALPSGLKTLATATVLRTHVIKPLLAAADDTTAARGPQNPAPLDRHYEALRTGMRAILHEWGIAA